MIRKETRHPLNNAHLTLHRELTETEKDKHEYPVKNISRGGLRFSSNDSYEIDERIEISVFLKDQEVHHAHARICYCTNDQNNGFYYGVSFLDKFVDMSLVS